MKEKKTTKKKKVKVLTLGDALKLHSPYSVAEAEKITKQTAAFYEKLRKANGERRFDLYTSTIQAISFPDGVMTNLRGNMNTATFAIAQAINILVREASGGMKLSPETVLLYCITDLAAEVRKIWDEEKQSNPTHVKIERVE